MFHTCTCWCSFFYSNILLSKSAAAAFKLQINLMIPSWIQKFLKIPERWKKAPEEKMLQSAVLVCYKIWNFPITLAVTFWSPFSWYDIKERSVLHMNYSTSSYCFHKTPYSDFPCDETGRDIWWTGNYVCLECAIFNKICSACIYYITFVL